MSRIILPVPLNYMKIRIFFFMDLDIPTVIGEADENLDEAKEIAGAVQFPSVLKTSIGHSVIVDRFNVNTVYRIPEK